VRDEQAIWAYLREQLPAHPELRARPAIIVGGGTGQRCFGCEELIGAEQSDTTSRYSCAAVSGDVHRFHRRCEAILDRARYPSGADLVAERRRREASPNG
jgi:hypothetical protein